MITKKKKEIYMSGKITRRGLIRVLSFAVALIAVLSAANIIYMHKLCVLNNAREAEYMRAVYELCDSSDKIYSALVKSKCATDPSMLTKLSNIILEESSSAKSALLDLPLTETELSGTEKYFSQIGNYAYYLSEKASQGEVSYEEYLTLSRICTNAKELRDKLYSLETELFISDKSLRELFDSLEDSSFITEGLSGIEKTLSETPKLIYDGPYSDHILEKEPLMTSDANPVPREDALRKAVMATGLEEWELSDGSDEEGKMPSYRFYADGVNVSVTKQGGYLSYMIKSRTVKTEEISVTDALRRAELYLETLGITDMEKTYYESYNNVMTVNFAYKQDDVICYTDLIKVSVALDNGEILGFDGRGFLTNHHTRSMALPSISKTQAQEKLSPNLEAVSSRLTLIPSDDIEEKICWEFKCKTDDGMEVLVYINAETGAEEDILILITLSGSILTA